MDCSTPGFAVVHHLPEFAPTHVRRVGDAIQPISSSVTPFSSCLHSFPASGSFPMSPHFASCGQSIGASASVLPMNILGWFPSGRAGLISLQSKGLSGVFSSTMIRRLNVYIGHTQRIIKYAHTQAHAQQDSQREPPPRFNSHLRGMCPVSI